MGSWPVSADGIQDRRSDTSFVTKKLIECPDCSGKLSPDAKVCPTCGRVNNWVHPALKDIEAMLRTWDYKMEIEFRGHEMKVKASYMNARQTIGWLLVALGVLALISSFAFGRLIGPALVLTTIGLSLVVFGLNGMTRKSIQIDIRRDDPIIGDYDQAFWRKVLERFEV